MSARPRNSPDAELSAELKDALSQFPDRSESLDEWKAALKEFEEFLVENFPLLAFLRAASEGVGSGGGIFLLNFSYEAPELPPVQDDGNRSLVPAALKYFTMLARDANQHLRKRGWDVHLAEKRPIRYFRRDGGGHKFTITFDLTMV